MEGFIDNNHDFISKEVAVMSLTHPYGDHWLVEPPYHRQRLEPEVEGNNYWLTRIIHGMQWELGDVAYTWNIRRIRKIANDAQRIYVYNKRHQMFIQGITSCEVVNLGLLLPPLDKLPLVKQRCLYHGIHVDKKFYCALNNAVRIKMAIWQNGGPDVVLSRRTPRPLAVSLPKPPKSSEETETAERHKEVVQTVAKPTENIEPSARPNKDTRTTGQPNETNRDRAIGRMQLSIPPITQEEPKKKKKSNTGSRRFIPLLMAFLTFGLINRAEGIIGYDCTSGDSEISTFSRFDIGNCDTPRIPTHSEVNLHLIQLKKYPLTQVKQCKVSIQKVEYRCNPETLELIRVKDHPAYIVEVNDFRCTLAHETKKIYIHPYDSFTGLEINATNTRYDAPDGELKAREKCTIPQHSLSQKTLSDVRVVAQIQITLREYITTTNLETNKVQLKSNVSCQLSSGTCIDANGESTFWDPLPKGECHDSPYELLYEGKATRIFLPDKFPRTMYIFSKNEITYAIIAKGTQMTCEQFIMSTENPRLFVFESKKPGMENLMTMNNLYGLDRIPFEKNTYIYRQRSSERLDNIYYETLKKRCENEQQELRHALLLINKSPSEFALRIMKKPGYTAIIAGEVIHILKCIPVEVTPRPTKECYQNLPVTRSGKDLYLKPISHILTRYGNPISCHPRIPPMYLFIKSWHKPSSIIKKIGVPQQIKPFMQIHWEGAEPDSVSMDIEDHSERDQDNKPTPTDDPLKGIGGVPHKDHSDEESMMLLINGIIWVTSALLLLSFIALITMCRRYQSLSPNSIEEGTTYYRAQRIEISEENKASQNNTVDNKPRPRSLPRPPSTNVVPITFGGPINIYDTLI